MGQSVRAGRRHVMPGPLDFHFRHQGSLMLNKETVQGIILQALRNINEERAADEQIQVDLDTRLFGADAVLDSLWLVSVIVDVEAALASASGRDISLTDDRAMGQEVSPFSDVGSLTDYILLLLSETE
jgi:acyl carrier protein